MKNTTLGYIEKDGKYLMMHRVKKVNDINHDKWIGIGGKVEPGESPHECMVREAYEETGLTIKHPKLCGVKNWFCDDGARYIDFLYKTDEFSGELKDSCEGRVFWTELKNLPGMNLASGMPELIEIYTNDNISELLYVKENGEQFLRFNRFALVKNEQNGTDNSNISDIKKLFHICRLLSDYNYGTINYITTYNIDYNF